VAEREAFAARLLGLYGSDPDAGLHGAIDWLLRQRWGEAERVAAIDAELTGRARPRRAVPDGSVSSWAVLQAGAPAGPGPGMGWYVNGEGQTFAVVRGPVEFTIGSPVTEPGRIPMNEQAHRKRVTRTFAVATREVTVEQFLRFRPNHDWVRRYSPGPDTPAEQVSWYDCAVYCNWLSEREGIPPDQWCYEPNPDGEYAPGMRIKRGHLLLTGYRLPTEVEWEFACRAGAGTAWYYGRGEALLPRYGWFLRTADDRAWPVGRLRPNDLGLFDTLGNVLEWCEDPGVGYDTRRQDDVDRGLYSSVDERLSRVLRGGDANDRAVDLRCAIRVGNQPGFRSPSIGFRPTRTLPD
jgi:formylglycine-generating enzyme required for sulfatase activity